MILLGCKSFSENHSSLPSSLSLISVVFGFNTVKNNTKACLKVSFSCTLSCITDAICENSQSNPVSSLTSLSPDPRRCV